MAALLWLLLAYMTIPLPYDAPFFAWLRRQWLLEGLIVLVGLGAGALLLQRRRLSPVPSWWSRWWLWWLWAAASLAWSIDRGLSLRALLFYGACGLLAGLGANLAPTAAASRVWLSFLGGIAAVAGAEGMWQYVVSFPSTLPLFDALREAGQAPGWGGEVIRDFLVRKRLISLFGWPNLFGGFLLLAVPVTAGLGFTAVSRRARICWLGVAGLLAWCLLLTLSMGTWMAAVLAGGIAWWQWTPRRRSSLRTVWAVALLIAAISAGSFIIAKRARALILGSTVSRVVYVQGAARAVAHAPIQGSGLGTFGLIYQALKPREEVEGQHNAQHAHNTLAEIAAETGLMGVGLLLGFLWAVWRGIRYAQGLLARSVALGLLGFFVHSLIEQTFVEAITAPFWWLTLGVFQGLAPAPPASSRWRFSWHWGWVPAAACLVLGGRLMLADWWATRAALAGPQQDPAAASGALGRAAAWDPWTHRYPLEAAERFWQQGHKAPAAERGRLLQAAEEQIQRAVQLSPWLGYAWRRQAQIAWERGDRAGAVSAMEQAVRRDPNAREARLELAAMLRATGRWHDVLRVARDFQRLAPERPEGWALESQAQAMLENAE